MDASMRLAVNDLYAEYVECVDNCRYEAWPEFFTESCRYRIVSRENYEAGLPMSALSLEGKAMLKDRVYGVTQTIFHAPYYQRHVVGHPRITDEKEGVLTAQANYIVVRTRHDAFSEVFNAGRYLDSIVTEGGRLKFRQRICIFDSVLVPNSIIYPI